MENIYFITTKPFANHVKIGKTRRKVDTRLPELQTGSFMRLVIYKSLYVPNNLNLENEMHKLLRNKRRIGEWFEMSLEEIDEVYDEFKSYNEPFNNIDADDDDDDIDFDIDYYTNNLCNEDYKKFLYNDDNREELGEIKCDGCSKMIKYFSDSEMYGLLTEKREKSYIDNNGNIIYGLKIICKMCDAKFAINKNLFTNKPKKYKRPIGMQLINNVVNNIDKSNNITNNITNTNININVNQKS